VIGTDVEGIRDVIQHRKTGLLCQPDVQSIRAAILELHSNPQLRRELGGRARQFVIKNFSLEKVVEQEIQIYQSVMRSFDG
jgi:glycosyltransferase involved in cell wall biosynthesis